MKRRTWAVVLFGFFVAVACRPQVSARQAVVGAFNVADVTLAQAAKTAPDSELSAYRTADGYLAKVLEALRGSSEPCSQLPGIQAAIRAVPCAPCDNAMALAIEVCQ